MRRLASLRSTLGLALFGLIALGLFTVSPALARNVPGSAAVVQPQIDSGVSTSMLDSILASVGSEPNACQDFTREVSDGNKPLPCDWGLTVGGGVRVITGSPDGYDFDYSSSFGHVIATRTLSASTRIFGGVVVEGGAGNLAFNDGTLANEGVGAIAGALLGLTDGVQLSLLGGTEWLRYQTTRSGGAFTGDYDAVRTMADARLNGLYDGGTFFVEYGGGLRFIHQSNSSYDEMSAGTTGASVPGSEFSRLTGSGSLKIGVPMGAFTPYVETRAFADIFNDSSSGTPFSDALRLRLGAGVDADVLSGKLSLATGAYLGRDGYEGVDATVHFTKSF